MPLFRTLSPQRRIFTNIPTLETERLTLRRMLPKDALDMYEYARRPDVTEYLTWYEHDSPEYTKSYLKALQRAYARGEFFDWALILRSENKMIGTCGFTALWESDLKGEIGYVLSPDYRGLGLMTEAAKRVIAFGFDELGLARIEARHVFGNERSAAVMRRCGMEYEGTLRKSMMIKGELKTVSVYAILKEDRARLTERKQ